MAAEVTKVAKAHWTDWRASCVGCDWYGGDWGWESDAVHMADTHNRGVHGKERIER